MNKTKEKLVEARKKIKEQISNLELKMEVIQDNLKDTKSTIRELKEIFNKIEEKLKEFKK